MKYLILLMLSACAAIDPKPVYDTIYGDWKFSAPDVSGSFTIDKDTIKNGTFIVLGKSLSADERKVFFFNQPFDIELVNQNGYIVLELVEPNKTFDTLYCPQYSFGLTSATRNIYPVTITRK